jgi:hypothetical protein
MHWCKGLATTYCRRTVVVCAAVRPPSGLFSGTVTMNAWPLGASSLGIYVDKGDNRTAQWPQQGAQHASVERSQLAGAAASLKCADTRGNRPANCHTQIVCYYGTARRLYAAQHERCTLYSCRTHTQHSCRLGALPGLAADPSLCVPCSPQPRREQFHPSLLLHQAWAHMAG